VLVDDHGVAKLCDFGLLRLVHESAPTGMTTTSSHTGTVRYLSYELISIKDDDDDDDESDDSKSDETKPTTASDVYALACIGVQVG
jgi:serine/threonine protein kinase